MLIDYIRVMEGVVSAEKLEFLTRANALFLAYTQTHTDVLIGSLMDNNGSREYSNMLDEVYYFIEEGLDYLADELGIDFADINMQDKMLVLETFKQIEDFDDSDTIVRLLEADTSLHERIVDVLSFVAGQDWTVFSDLITEVTTDTLTEIYTIHVTRKNEQEEKTSVVRSKEIDRIKAYTNKYPNTLLEYGIRNSTYRPGLPLKPIFNEHIATLRSYALNDDFMAAAINIVGLLLVTNVPLIQYANVARAISENIFSNVNFVSRVNTQINIIASEVTSNG